MSRSAEIPHQMDEATPLQGARASSFPWRSLLVTVAATVSNTGFGYDVGVVSGVLADLASSLDLDMTQQELFTGGLNFVSAAGALLVAGDLLDRLGRRSSLLVGSLLLIVGGVTTAASRSLVSLLIGRSLQGLGCGSVWVTSAVYVAETSPPKWRGFLVSLCDVSIAAGTLLGYLVDGLVQASIVSADARWWQTRRSKRDACGTHAPHACASSQPMRGHVHCTVGGRPSRCRPRSRSSISAATLYCQRHRAGS